MFQVKSLIICHSCICCIRLCDFNNLFGIQIQGFFEIPRPKYLEIHPCDEIDIVLHWEGYTVHAQSSLSLHINVLHE